MPIHDDLKDALTLRLSDSEFWEVCRQRAAAHVQYHVDCKKAEASKMALFDLEERLDIELCLRSRAKESMPFIPT